MTNYLVIFAFNGRYFHGTQKQKDLPTVQSLFEEKLSYIYDTPVKFTPCSRLDRGVNALKMGGNFLIEEEKIEGQNLKYVLNRLFPHYLRVLSVEEVPTNFSARFNAICKTYRYDICLDEEISPFLSETCLYPVLRTDKEIIKENLELFVGTHDFKAFASPEGKENTILTIDEAYFEEIEGSILRLRFKGKKFLRYQIRFMVGALISLAQEKTSKEAILSCLAGRIVEHAKLKAWPNSLYLEDVVFEYNRD